MGASAFDRANRAGPLAGSEFARWCARGRPPVDRFLLVAGRRVPPGGRGRCARASRRAGAPGVRHRVASAGGRRPAPDRGDRRGRRAAPGPGGRSGRADARPRARKWARATGAAGGRLPRGRAARGSLARAALVRPQLVPRLRGRGRAGARGPGELRPAARPHRPAAALPPWAGRRGPRWARRAPRCPGRRWNGRGARARAAEIPALRASVWTRRRAADPVAGDERAAAPTGDRSHVCARGCVP